MSKEEVVEAPDGTLEQGDFKIKKKPKKLVTKEKVTKVNMAKKEEPKEEPKPAPPKKPPVTSSIYTTQRRRR